MVAAGEAFFLSSKGDLVDLKKVLLYLEAPVVGLVVPGDFQRRLPTFEYC